MSRERSERTKAEHGIQWGKYLLKWEQAHPFPKGRHFFALFFLSDFVLQLCSICMHTHSSPFPKEPNCLRAFPNVVGCQSSLIALFNLAQNQSLFCHLLLSVLKCSMDGGVFTVNLEADYKSECTDLLVTVTMQVVSDTAHAFFSRIICHMNYKVTSHLKSLFYL